MRTLILVIISLAAGFFIHALFFPNTFTGLGTLSAKQIVTSNAAGGAYAEKSTTFVHYKNGAFTPQRAVMTNGYYVEIINDDPKNGMWLISDYPELNTKRVFGESESLRVIMPKAGNYTIADKLHPAGVLALIVQ